MRLLSIVVRRSNVSPGVGGASEGPRWIPFLPDNSRETGALIVDGNTLATQRGVGGGGEGGGGGGGGKREAKGPRDSSPDLSPLDSPEPWEGKVRRTPPGLWVPMARR